MIVLLRRHAHQFWSVLRRCVSSTDRSRRDPVVMACAGPEGLSLRAVLAEVALRLDIGGEQQAAKIAFPGSVLAGCEGESDEPVHLEANSKGQGRATFQGAGGSRSIPFSTEDPSTLPAFPELPGEFHCVESGLLRALHDAAQSTAKDPTRFALNRILLRGKVGAVVATDSKELLVQSGFAFPWEGDVLVPRLDVLDAPWLRQEEAIALGRTKTHTVLRVGPWTFVLAIDTDHRFPPYEEVLPRAHVRTTRLMLPPGEIKRLMHELPRLPGRQEEPATVLLAIGERIAVVGKGDDGTGTLELPEAKAEGSVVEAACDRRQLHRALRLGFHTLHIQSPSKPLFCRDERRTFLFMPVTWDGSDVPPPTKSPMSRRSASPVSQPLPETPTMAGPSNNSRVPLNGDSGRHPADAIDPLVEAEELRVLLQTVQTRMSRLLASLKQFRRQSRAVSAAVASLRQLPPLVP